MSQKQYGHQVQTIMRVSLGEVDIQIKPIYPWYSNDETKMPVLRLSLGNGQDELFWLTQECTDALFAALLQIKALKVQTPRTVFTVTH